ncbi:MAG TPA: YicC/YloC family endoribonuclease [Polyangiaceae bacterium]|nr:YicC/YloC family endoribonuclease [Polyangiaceae bacterium]
MRSMTGFGFGEAPLGTGKLGVEIRGVNHRFLDVRVRVPRDLGDLVGYVEQVAREWLTRGRYEVALRVDGIVLGAPTLDRERAKAAFRALCDLRDELAPGSDVPLSLLASVPDLFVSPVEREMDRVREATRAAFESAVQALDEMREREGSALRADLARRLEQARQLAVEILRRSPDVLEAHRRRLAERAGRLRATMEIDIDAVRLEQEIAMFADRCDVTEELTRLESHCAQLARLLKSAEPIGRRLDFLLQEMARETNTIGAKTPDAQVAHAVVELKVEIERMREQVQNVE